MSWHAEKQPLYWNWATLPLRSYSLQPPKFNVDKPTLWLGQCFLSRFWVSTWLSIILQWHPKFWKPRYGFAFYWSKTISGKHVFLHMTFATDGCNVIGWHIFLAQKLEAKIVSLVSVRCHAHSLASASYYTATDFYSMVYETAKALYAIMELFRLHANLSKWWRDTWSENGWEPLF